MDAFRQFLCNEHAANGHASNVANEPGAEEVPAKAYSADALRHAGLPEDAGRSGGSADSDTTTSSENNVSCHAPLIVL